MSQPDVTKTPLIGWRGWNAYTPCHLTSGESVWPKKKLRLRSLSKPGRRKVSKINYDMLKGE